MPESSWVIDNRCIYCDQPVIGLMRPGRVPAHAECYARRNGGSTHKERQQYTSSYGRTSAFLSRPPSPSGCGLNHLLEMTPDQFENAIADLLTDLGYYGVERVGGRGDLAVDLKCREQGGRLVLVQCKRYAVDRPIGSRDLQTFIGMMTVHHRADTGIFVTTSRFTKGAAELAACHPIELINGAQLEILFR